MLAMTNVIAILDEIDIALYSELSHGAHLLAADCLLALLEKDCDFTDGQARYLKAHYLGFAGRERL